MQPDCLLAYQTVIMVLGCTSVLAAKRISIRIPLADVGKLLALGAVGMGVTDYFLNLSYQYLPVSTAVMLHFMYPAIVLVASCLLFHQKLSSYTVGAVLLSITGLVLVTDLQGSMDLSGVLFALGSAVSYSIFSIGNDRGSVNRLPLIVKLFYMSAVSALIYCAETFAKGHFSLPSNGKVAGVMICIVGLGSLAAFYLITAGIQRIGASKAAFLNMLEPITGIICGAVFYQESFPSQSKIGCLCVLSSVLLIAMDSRQKKAS
jgi:drug/metabolite transporter (DMT)-like permease